MSTATITEVEKGYELKITRVFDAPRELVWKAWTDPEMAKQWMGPRGFTTVDFARSNEVGGPWLMSMEGFVPAIQQMATLHQGGVMQEIKPPELLVYSFAWRAPADIGLTDKDIQEMTVIVHFAEKGKKTVMTFTQGPFLSERARDGHTGGWNSAFDKFAEFMLAEQPGRVDDPHEVPTELHLKRFFAAPRKMVYEAWMTPESVAQWWGPRHFTTTVHTWDARIGGEIYVVMHGPDGVSHPMSGKFIEFQLPDRFHFTAAALDKDGKPMFENWNSVFLEDVEGGTLVTVDVHVMQQTEVAPQYLKGMKQGWNLSLDKLGEWLVKQ
jgi:uncharacterized protein YndB with AHSA1/START domain